VNYLKSLIFIYRFFDNLLFSGNIPEIFTNKVLIEIIFMHFNDLNWNLLVKHLVIEDIHNSWLYCFTNPFKLRTYVSLFHHQPYVCDTQTTKSCVYLRLIFIHPVIIWRAWYCIPLFAWIIFWWQWILIDK